MSHVPLGVMVVPGTRALYEPVPPCTEMVNETFSNEQKSIFAGVQVTTIGGFIFTSWVAVSVIKASSVKVQVIVKTVSAIKTGTGKVTPVMVAPVPEYKVSVTASSSHRLPVPSSHFQIVSLSKKQGWNPSIQHFIDPDFCIPAKLRSHIHGSTSVASCFYHPLTPGSSR